MTDLEKQTFAKIVLPRLGRRGTAMRFSLSGIQTGGCTIPSQIACSRAAKSASSDDLTKAIAPHLMWKLVDWTSRGDVVVIEWESSNRYGEHVIVWRGVDKMTLRDGKIIEEIVYCDTAPLQALRRGMKFDALIQFPD